MNGRALIYGTIAIDTLITPGGQVNSVMGGSGPYAALAARLVTDKVDMVGVVGDDFPAAWEKALELRGVSMEHVAHEPGQTFAWTGQYEADMNKRTTVSRTDNNGNLALQAEQILRMLHAKIILSIVYTKSV